MKKILLVLMSLCMLSSVCFASMADKVNAISSYTGETKKVSVLLDAPLGYMSNEEIRNIVVEKANEMFPTPQFLVTPFEDSQMMKQIYREEHNMPTVEYASTFGTALKMADIQAIGQSLDADYVLFIQVSDSGPSYSNSSSWIPFVGSISSSKAKTSVKCDIRIMNISTGKYVAMKQTVKDGADSSSSFMGIGGDQPSFDKAYQEAIERCLYELDIDTSTL
ncbi:MAG TPA: hypothetical protein K8V25_07255 [Megamonas hypermegale]|uniref:hypothetical protein n=2 Tax=Megamonas hypermegale TaxID=158847 RepID=UPI001DE36E23|nr:hypothetical protein [Megamonas hypermegale]HJG08031.1 hypothetical protein [Megamonas hypermegale]